MTDQTQTAPAQAEAQAQIAALKRDPDFSAKFAAGNADARQQMSKLIETAHGGQVTTIAEHTSSNKSAPMLSDNDRTQAQERIKALRRDPEFAERFARGDRRAREEMAKLHQQAYAGEETTIAGEVDEEPAKLDAADVEALTTPPDSSGAYDLPQFKDDAGNVGPEETKLAEFVGNALHVARFPREVGSSLAREVGRVWEQTGNLDDAAYKGFVQTERAKLEKLWGDKFNHKLGLAQQLVQELDAKKPGTLALLERTGAASSAQVIAMLAAHAEALHARAGG